MGDPKPMNDTSYPPNDDQPEDDKKTESGHEIPAHLMPDEEASEPATSAEEVRELNERVLRLAAELDNTRKRADREKVDAGKYAIANFVRDLLSVADVFERALQAVPEGESIAPDAVDGFVTGVKMTETELLRTLERHGVKKIKPLGEKFDPHVHQAVAQAPAAGVPSGHVAQVAQPGFILGDRVLRAAMVIVSTGEPEVAGDSAQSEASE